MAATKQQNRSKRSSSGSSTAKRSPAKTKRSSSSTGNGNGTSRSRASSPQTRARATKVVRDTEPTKPVAAVKDTASTAVEGAGKAARTVGRVVAGAAPVATAVAGAAAGVVGGVLLSKSQQKSHKVLGLKLPKRRKSGADGIARSVGEAGRQFGKLASEVRIAREKAERIGKALG
jgi:hypothetical protein